jgi:hypothetical protein
LWECWIIEGLADNRWAILTKIHHCIADGIAAAHVLASLFDDGEGDSYASHIHAVENVGPRGLRLPKPSLDPRDWVSGMAHFCRRHKRRCTRRGRGNRDCRRPLASGGGGVADWPRHQFATLQRGAVSLDDVKKVMPCVRHDVQRCCARSYHR